MKKVNIHLFRALVLLLGVGLITMTACDSGQQKKEKGKDQKISILYPNWAEGIAFTHLAKVALEEQGYTVEVTPIEPGPIYASLAKGDADLFFDAWLPHTHKDYWEKYGDNIDKLGESFSNGTTGLVVPDYVEEESIEDLNAVKDKYDGKIIGIGSGAGIHANTEKAIKEYDLDFEQTTSSGPAMVASLQKAYKKEEPIIITGWKPHHKWNDYDLKYLDDPKEIFPKDVMAILSRKGFSDEMPKVAEFCDNFGLKEKQLYDLMELIDETGNPEKASKKWYEENKDMVDAWFPSN